MKKIRTLIEGKALVYVHPSTTVYEAVFMMARARIGAVVVLDDGRLAGIFTERDLLNRVIVGGLDPKTTLISEVMTRNVAVAGGDDTCQDGLEIMKRMGCRHLPIADGERLIGIISMRDLLLHDNIEKDSEIRMMNYLYYYQAPVMGE